MRFWGWGEDARAHGLAGHAVPMLREALDLPADARGERVGLADVRVGPARLGVAAHAALTAVVGDDRVRDDHVTRVLHAAGKSLPDLLRQRAGDATGAPDAVVSPVDHAEVLEVLRVCSDVGVAVVPFGGGTSVVGGVEPERGPFDAVVALDLRRLDQVRVDEQSMTAHAGPGLLLPDLEARLAPHDMTLGHFPQSYEHATVGGCVATRSAGQASTGYGRIDANVVGLTLAAPAGGLRLPALPPNAAGPDLRELVVGSEGTLGVITDVALRVHPAPRVTRYEGLFFRSFAEGADAYRRIVQMGAQPDVARLSDEEETRLALAQAGGGAKASVAGAYLRLRGIRGGCLAIAGWEGEPDDVARRRIRTLALMKRAGAVSLGESPGRSWVKGRYHGPYVRDDLLDRGIAVETLETAHTWTGLSGLYHAVGDAIRSTLSGRGTPPLVMCHISHLYETGASLYFTWLARSEPGRELEQWRAVKTAASDAIVAAGGTITHHHAVGRDHRDHLRHEVGDLGLAALRAVKERFDPDGVMNPGKLLPEAAAAP